MARLRPVSYINNDLMQRSRCRDGTRLRQRRWSEDPVSLLPSFHRGWRPLVAIDRSVDRDFSLRLMRLPKIGQLASEGRHELAEPGHGRLISGTGHGITSRSRFIRTLL